MGSAKYYYSQEQWSVDLYSQIRNRAEMLEQEIAKRQALNVRKRKEVILEHFGKMDDFRYVSKNIPKIDIYQKNGFFPGDNFIMSFETSQYPLDVRTIDILIVKYLL